MCSSPLSWEESAHLLTKHVLEPCGYQVVALSRVPYLSQVLSLPSLLSCLIVVYSSLMVV